MNNKIETFDLPVPKEINTEVINYLGNKAKWGFVVEPTAEIGGQFSEVIADKRTDAGMYQITYSHNNSIPSIIPDHY